MNYLGLFYVVTALCCMTLGQQISEHNTHHDSLADDTREEVLRIVADQSNVNNFTPEDAELDDVSDQWSELLQNVTVSRPTVSARTAKATYGGMGGMPNQFNPYRRVGEAPPLRNDGPVNNNFQPFRQAPVQFGNRLFSPSDVSETDLYLLSAIEKLVYRVDYLEKRLQKTDKLVLHLIGQVNIQQQQQQHQQNNQVQQSTVIQATQTTTATVRPITSIPPQTTATVTVTAAPPAAKSDCPKDFTRIAANCYHIEAQTPTDWQTANLRCKSHGGRLAEFDKASTLKQVKTHLLDVMGKEPIQLWLGGLNPGLLWIWSSSAKPVDTFTTASNASQDATSIQSIKKHMDIAGNGRCLNLMSNGTKRVNLKYFGEDCSKPHSYLCELHDRTVENTISRVLRALRLD